MMSRSLLVRPSRSFSTTIGNIPAAVGTMLGHELTRIWRPKPDGTVISFDGSAETFGAFVPKGNTLRVWRRQ